MSSETTEQSAALRREAMMITRREAIMRVTALLGGAALVGGSALLTGCRADGAAEGGPNAIEFTAEEIALLDEIADTILPDTERSPGAKAAQTGAFMALMVRDTYDARDQEVFRDGMRQIDEASRQANNAGFVQATPQQRLALLERIDREAKEYMDRRAAAGRPAVPAIDEEAAAGDGHLPDQRQEAAPTGEANPATAITADAPAHYFRMMKELSLLGFFTSEIGYNQAMRYQESPGRWDPCIPYTAGEPAWAPHA